jgi:hypothetical protein
MAPRLFISYRRDDSAGYSGRVHDQLQREFGGNLLFMDVDSIPLGTNFVKVIGEEVAKCKVLLAVIGSGWLEARDEKGNRRLDNPDDFVRIEIGTALKRGIPVIPILLEGTRVPKAEQLPDDLKELALRNGLDVRHASFSEDIERLVRGLKGARSPQQHAAVERFVVPWHLAPFGAFGAVLPAISGLASRSDAFAFVPELSIIIGQIIYVGSAALLSTIFPYGRQATPFKAVLVGVFFPTIVGTALSVTKIALPGLTQSRGGPIDGVSILGWVVDTFALF